MDIRKNIIEFIPNLKMLNTLANDILAQVDITDDRYKKVIDFYSDSENIAKFESMVLHLSLYENQENRIMLFKSIEEELEKFILLYADGKKYFVQFVEWRIDDLKIKETLAELQKNIETNTALGSKACKCLKVIDEKTEAYKDDDDQSLISTLEIYRRKVVEYHMEITMHINNSYLRYKEMCNIEELYQFRNLFETFCMVVSFHNILSKYIPKDIASNNEKIKLILQLHEEYEEYDSECDYSDFELDSDLNIIQKNSFDDSLLDMEVLSKVYKICNNNQFEEISQPDFFFEMNIEASSQRLKVKSGEKVRVCYLIHILSHLIEDPSKRLSWKEELLKRLGISEKYYKSKYTEPIIDVPSKRSEDFVNAMRSIIK